MKKITLNFLKSNNACDEGVKWVTENGMIGLPANLFINKLIKNDKLLWANWLIVRLINKKQRVMYAIFAAEQVLPIYEKKYSDDRPRKAIEAAKRYLNNQTKKNKDAANTAAYAAYAVSNVANATYAADAAAYAAYAAANIANAAYAAYAAANIANAVANAAAKRVKNSIINYGLSLIK